LNDCQLNIIGDGGELNELKKANANVIFSGHVANPDLGTYYNAANIFMTASQHETCGFTTGRRGNFILSPEEGMGAWIAFLLHFLVLALFF